MTGAELCEKNGWKIGDVLFASGSDGACFCTPHLFVAERLPASDQYGFGRGCYSQNDKITRLATLADADRLIGYQEQAVQRETERLKRLSELRAIILKEVKP